MCAPDTRPARQGPRLVEEVQVALETGCLVSSVCQSGPETISHTCGPGVSSRGRARLGACVLGVWAQAVLRPRELMLAQSRRPSPSARSWGQHRVEAGPVRCWHHVTLDWGQQGRGWPEEALI